MAHENVSNVDMMLRDEDVERLLVSRPPDSGLRPRGHTRDIQTAAEAGAGLVADVGTRVGKGAVGAVRRLGVGMRRRQRFLPTGGKGYGGEDENHDAKGQGETERKGQEFGAGETRETREVWFNNRERNAHFPSNYVSTTKYSPLNVVPKFLSEQFTRFSNAYFLFVGILYCIDAITPVFTVGRYSGLWVLAVVVTISGIKEAIEDVRRYRQDRMVNRAITEIVGSANGGEDADDRWDSVKVGDIVKVRSKETFPADLVLLASSSEDGLAFVETKQLDGESNLKVKVIPPALANVFSSDSRALLVHGKVECEVPNDRLYKFQGAVTLDAVPPASSNDPYSSALLSSSALPELGTPVNSVHESTFDSPSFTHSDRTSRAVESSPASEKFIPPPMSETPLLHTRIPLGPESLLIRGSSLRNTNYILGLVINTGRDTKLMQNVKPRPRKNSRLERMTNKFLAISLLLQVAIVVALTIRSSQLCRELFVDGFAWYLLEKDGCNSFDSALRFLTFFATFAGLIPISLYVSMEIARGWQVYFIERDMFIKDHTSGTKTEVRTSNLNEELGVVHYLFTDKTGTLTANRMDFKKASIGGRVYSWTSEPENGATRLQDLCDAIEGGPDATASSSFTPGEVGLGEMGLRLLAICHSVVAEVHQPVPGLTTVSPSDVSTGGNASDVEAESGGRLNFHARHTSDASTILANASGPTPDVTYQASSPDEAALVAAARMHGFQFISRSNRELVIQVNGVLEEYELMEVLEFDSTRKRMSVIVRDPDGDIKVFTKGADSVIFERLAADQDPEATSQHLHDFAVEGLRTLCLAYAVLDESFYQKWKLRYMQASSQMENRDEAVAAVAEEVERGLILIGATAIEDKLQDGVPETLRMLEQASVKVWVLTGDKQETAINIGLSCGAIEDGMDVYIINEDNVEDTAAQIDCAIGRWKALLHDPGMEGKLGLVIDGQTLHYALQPQLQRKLMHLGRMARSVIACRVSPKQKTELVELVRFHEKDKVTLAIGDGANDVGMIQAAHVGVGIVGVEGQEAKLASDYSIGQFRFLQRLMLVHGRWSYKRLSKMVLYTVYKNMALTLCELYWATSTAFTGQPLLDPWMAGVYNLFCASIPPIVLGILDQELAAEYALSFPEIYVKGQRNTAFNLRVFLHWMTTAIWHSALIFYMTVWGLGDQPQGNGQHLGMWGFGTVVFTLVIIVVHCFACLYQSAWTRLTIGLYLISFLSWFFIGPLFSTETVSLSTDLSPPLFGVTHRIFSDARVWFLIFVVPVLCVSPGLLWKYSKRQRRPNLKMLVQELIRSGQTREDITAGMISKPIRRLPSYDPEASGLQTPMGPATFVKGEQNYTFSGFNFDGDEGVSLLVRRHAYANSKGVRKRRMRVLKRAGSDTELDVAGVTTGDSRDDSLENTTLRLGPDRGSYHRRQGPGMGIPEDFLAADFPGDVARPPPAARSDGRISGAHRRAMSDGAVLVEDRYDRVAHRDGTNVNVRSPRRNTLSSEPESEGWSHS